VPTGSTSIGTFCLVRMWKVSHFYETGSLLGRLSPMAGVNSLCSAVSVSNHGRIVAFVMKSSFGNSKRK
jgi:hypothetical protein